MTVISWMTVAHSVIAYSVRFILSRAMQLMHRLFSIVLKNVISERKLRGTLDFFYTRVLHCNRAQCCPYKKLLIRHITVALLLDCHGSAIRASQYWIQSIYFSKYNILLDSRARLNFCIHIQWGYSLYSSCRISM